jgi:4-aminobutyrate aminotransferase/(S)-3-amino-2-methylpropionate transaminase
LGNNKQWLARRSEALPIGLSTAMPVCTARALNAQLWDVEGRRYVDFASGIAVLNVGHCHPRVIAAARAQLDAFTHTAFQVTGYESYVALAERLNTLAPIEGKAKSVFFSTGAEAVENAVKIARAATGRSAVIAFSGAFHGRTLMALALTGKVAPYKQGFGPMPPEVFHAPFPSDYRGISTSQSLQALEDLLHHDVAADRVAAVIVEPVQGEGGFHPAPDDFLRQLRAWCDAHGIVLIVDEIQSGFGRTGRLFAVEHAEVKPDLITVAKSLAGGFPLSGVIGRAELLDRVAPGGLGGTYAGSPLACAAALATLDVIAEERLCERAQVLGQHVLRRLEKLAGQDNLRPIGNVRGRGSMLAFDLLTSRGSAQPDPAATRAVVQRAHALGLIVLTCGALGESIRLLYPLTIADTLLDEGLDLLEQALRLP